MKNLTVKLEMGIRPLLEVFVAGEGIIGGTISGSVSGNLRKNWSGRKHGGVELHRAAVED